MSKLITNIPDEMIENKIFVMRDCKVIFDYDLAELYGVPTKALNQAVSRNKARFPVDFCFRLTLEEMRDQGDLDIYVSDILKKGFLGNDNVASI